MTETTTEAPAPAPTTVLTYTLPGLTGERSFDCGSIPAEQRLEFLKNAVRNYIANRVNAVQMAYNKDERVLAWDAYEKATASDPLQTAVPKPEYEKPTAPDLEAAHTRAVEDLAAGKVKQRGKTGERKTRERKDPLIKHVTKVVTDEVYEARKSADSKFTYIAARQLVGDDGIAYLNKMIDAKVEAGADRAQLEQVRDSKYIKPARIMLGLDTDKKMAALPSIL